MPLNWIPWRSTLNASLASNAPRSPPASRGTTSRGARSTSRCALPSSTIAPRGTFRVGHPGKGLLNLRVLFILGKLGEHFELLRLKQLGGGGLDERIVFFLEEAIEPAERGDLKLLNVFVEGLR